MTKYDDEVVVRVDTLEEYRAVLDKWFAKGYAWSYGISTSYHEEYFKGGGRYLILDDGLIGYSAGKHVRDENLKVTSFKEFMAKELGVTPGPNSIGDIPEQEPGKVTYEVSEEQMAFIKEVKDSAYPASSLVINDNEYMNMFDEEYGTTFERDLLRYLGGDESVVFQLKDPLFMLKGKDTDGDAVYFTTYGVGVPTYTYVESEAFTASHEEITLWNTPFWEIVLVGA